MPPLTLVKQNKPAKPMEIPNKTKKGLIKTLIKSVTAACIGYVMFVTLKNGNKVDELEDEIDDLSANADNAAVKLRIKRLVQRKHRYDQLFKSLRSLTNSLD